VAVIALADTAASPLAGSATVRFDLDDASLPFRSLVAPCARGMRR
jgi:hypothetical protein